MTPRTRNLAGVAVAAMLALMLMAPSAAATNPPIAISDDGATYGASFPGQLFGGVYLVPNTSTTRTFWVKNTGPSAANLALTIRDVSSDDPDLLAGLGIAANSSGHSGNAHLDEVGACASLLRGVYLVPGQAAQINVTLAMANVSGTTAQGSTAAFNLGVNLTSDDVPAPNGCTPPTNPEPKPSPSVNPHVPGGGGTVVVPGVTPAPTEPGASPSATPSSSPSTAPSATPSATPSPEPSASPSPEPTEPTEPAIEGNTDRFYQEWFVAAWVVSFAIGGLLAWRIIRSRQREGTGS